MPYIIKLKKPSVTMDVMEQLRERPGLITYGLFLFRVTTEYGPASVWFALHVAKKLLSREFEFVVKQSSKTKVFIRPSGSSDNAILEAASDVSFRLDNRTVKIVKVHELMVKDRTKDILLKSPVSSFPASYDQLSVEEMAAVGYPAGYSGQADLIERYTHVQMSATVMSILGVSQGKPRGLVSVMIKYFPHAHHINDAIKAVPSDFPFKLVVDHDGMIFMKFANPSHAEAMSSRNYFIDGHMIKFYHVQFARPIYPSNDKSYLPLYSTTVNDDSFQIRV